MADPVAYVLVGPTGVGKSAVAQVLAESSGAVIVSADAMLVYEGMDIGTAKPTRAERGRVPHLGIDLAAPDKTFDAAAYRASVLVDWDSVAPPEQPRYVVGGTGLYVAALLRGLSASPPPDPARRAELEALHARHGVAGLQDELDRVAPGRRAALADDRNPRRLIRALEGAQSSPAWPIDRETCTLVGLDMEPRALEARLLARIQAMYDGGLLEEAQSLRARYALSRTALQAIGYAEAWAVLDGVCSHNEAVQRTLVRTRQLAKRQRTWFRRQHRVHWVNVAETESPALVAERVAEAWRTYGPCSIHH